MKTAYLLPALLLTCCLHCSQGLAEEKKKDKVAEWQKQQFEAQQRLQQWKLQQMQKQQQQPPQKRARVPVAPQPQAFPQQPQPLGVPPQFPAAGGAQNNGTVRLEVSNFTDAPVSVWWVAGPGQLQSYGTINPTQAGEQPYVMETFAGHSWQFTSGRTLIKSHTAGSQPVQAVVLGDRALANPPIGGGAVIANQPPIGARPAGGFVGQPAQFPPPVAHGGAVIANPPIVPGLEDPGIGAVAANDPAVADFLRVHNQARAEVGVPPLQWSDKLAQVAQQWADQLAATGDIKHSPPGRYGENIGWGSPPFTPARGANYWLEEKTAFRPGQKTFNDVGHYTQMIWRKTTHVGFGTAQVNGMTVVVANYEPAGNIGGQTAY